MNDFNNWMTNGIANGWITKPYCNTHDGVYSTMSKEEVDILDTDEDSCINVIRILKEKDNG